MRSFLAKILQESATVSDFKMFLEGPMKT